MDQIKPTIKVQHTPLESRATSASSISGKNKRNDHLGVFRSASPVTGNNASSNNENNLFLALPNARSHGGRSLSAASLYNENGVPCPLSDEKLLIK